MKKIYKMNKRIRAEEYSRQIKMWLQKRQSFLPWIQSNKSKSLNTQINGAECCISVTAPDICRNLGILEVAKLQGYQNGKPLCTIFLAYIKNTPEHAKAIKNLINGYPQVQSILFFDCILSQQLFLHFSKTLKVRILSVQGCQMRDITFSKLQWAQIILSLNNIIISSDTFDNRSLKRLLSLNIPQLMSLRLKNTNITTDSIKTLNKRQVGPFYKINIIMQVRFNYGELLKKTNIHQKFYVIFMIGNVSKKVKESYVYLHHISKFGYDSTCSESFFFEFRKNKVTNFRNMLISVKAFKMMVPLWCIINNRQFSNKD